MHRENKNEIAELELKIINVKKELEIELERMKTEHIKWMFFIVLIGVLVATLALFLKS